MASGSEMAYQQCNLNGENKQLKANENNGINICEENSESNEKYRYEMKYENNQRNNGDDMKYLKSVMAIWK